MSLPRSASALVLVLTGMVVPLWWLALFTSVTVRNVFVPPASWPTLMPFLLADLGLAALTMGAGLQGLRGRLSRLLAGLTCGSWGYATLWTVGAVLTGALQSVGVMLMLTALVLVAFCCHALVPTSRAGID